MHVNLHCCANKEITINWPALTQSQGSDFLSHKINCGILRGERKLLRGSYCTTFAVLTGVFCTDSERK